MLSGRVIGRRLFLHQKSGTVPKGGCGYRKGGCVDRLPIYIHTTSTKSLFTSAHHTFTHPNKNPSLPTVRPLYPPPPPPPHPHPNPDPHSHPQLPTPPTLALKPLRTRHRPTCPRTPRRRANPARPKRTHNRPPQPLRHRTPTTPNHNLHALRPSSLHRRHNAIGERECCAAGCERVRGDDQEGCGGV